MAAGAAIAWLVYRWRKRPKPVPPPPPPRPPWEVALERLDEIRHAGLLETQRYGEYFDRVSDAVRQYLGARFGFDGLESTTDEMLAALRRVPHFGLPIAEVAAFLQECDLVKFADVTPSFEECQRALAQAERIVRTTMPRPAPVPPPSAGGRRVMSRSPGRRRRWLRGSLVALGTVVALALALLYPLLARGDAWRTATWSVWPAALGAHPSTADALGWLARAGGCVLLGLAVLATPSSCGG